MLACFGLPCSQELVPPPRPLRERTPTPSRPARKSLPASFTIAPLPATAAATGSVAAALDNSINASTSTSVPSFLPLLTPQMPPPPQPQPQPQPATAHYAATPPVPLAVPSISSSLFEHRLSPRHSTGPVAAPAGAVSPAPAVVNPAFTTPPRPRCVVASSAQTYFRCPCSDACLSCRCCALLCCGVPGPR